VKLIFKRTYFSFIQFNPIQFNLTEFTAINNLVAMVTMKYKQVNPQFSKDHLTTLNLDIFKMVEAMELQIIASWSP
jgi:hypothetical protein